MNRSNNQRIMFIRATAHASARIRRRIREHGREGFVDDGVGIIIASNGVPYADLDNTLFRAVAAPHWSGWINNNEWEVIDGPTN